MMSVTDLNIQLASAIKQHMPPGFSVKALHEPCLRGNESRYVQECIDTNWVSSLGKFVDRFEEKLAEYTGARYAIATVNGTAALHIAYQLAGVRADDEVLLPSVTFIATANAVRYCDAIPHFVDTGVNHPNVCPQKLKDYLNDIAEIKSGVCYNKKTGRVIRALCVVHILGHPADLDEIKNICEHYHLTMIEDASEALGSFYKGTHVGHAGLMGTLSFNGNKIVTTGGGGALLTNDPDIASRAKHLTTTGKVPRHREMVYDCVAYNYRLPNINAAMGCAQLETLPNFLAKKRELLRCYQAAVVEIDHVELLVEPDNTHSNYWLHALVLDRDDRDDVLAALHQEGIDAWPIWQLIHTLPMYQHCPQMNLNNSEQWMSRLIRLPSGVSF